MRVARSGLVLLLLAAACGRGPGELASASGDREAPAPKCSAPASSVAAPAGLEVTLSLSKQTLAPGEPLDMTISARNDGAEPVPYWHSGQRHDFWVEGPPGLVWVWSQAAIASGEDFQQFLRRDSFPAGGRRQGSGSWEQEFCDGSSGSLPSGRYVARGLWRVADPDGDPNQGWWTPPVEFEIG